MNYTYELILCFLLYQSFKNEYNEDKIKETIGIQLLIMNFEFNKLLKIPYSYF